MSLSNFAFLPIDIRNSDDEADAEFLVQKATEDSCMLAEAVICKPSQSKALQKNAAGI